MLGGSWEVATLEANADFDWGVTYYPVSETGTAVSPCGDWAAVVARTVRIRMQQANSFSG